MNAFAQVLEPADAYLPGLLDGTFALNLPSQRLTERATGRFVAALVPGEGLQRALSALPPNVALADAQISASPTLSALAPLLKTMQIVNTVGALASVANLGASCVGFGLVLHRLGRIEGKLDEMLAKLDVLQDSVRQVQVHADALSLARVRAAGDSLDRALAAETAPKRRELATHARDLFQESRLFFLELWRAARPWHQLHVPVQTALEIQSRYVACAIGEIQAEFICGDMGAFRHAVQSGTEDLRTHMKLDGPGAFRERSDAACAQTETLGRFGLTIVDLAAQMRSATAVTTWTATRLESFSADADLPAALGLEPHDVVRATRAAKGDGLYVLRRIAA